ncbi:tetratricopeptide repeat protein [Alicyclobacillus sp. SO9]|uniref:helix-turn-helix domain-containing protein n=1 Tax=Alicyclobacillus sp. SO9 TaxID=2665646 RepID=UPI0018E851E9|nr:tetratricopeptide repeat protein [Alicyclobacillus sp. SO9]QQE76914.1 tetratricopeptide repeat protein [Alicyclobacillus sp. SO9]
MGAKIRMLRKARHMTQQELGGTLISASMVSQIEANRALPSETVLESISKALGVSKSFFKDEFHVHESTQRYRRAKTLMDGNQYHEALELYVTLIASPPPQVRLFTLYTETAQCYQHIGDLENATQMYNYAAEAALESDEAAVAVHSYYQLGTLQRKREKLRLARMYWFRGQQLLLRHKDLKMPISMKIHANLGRILYMLGEYRAAFESYQHALDEAQNYSATLDLAIVYHGLANVRVKLREFGKATEDTNRAVALYESVRHMRGRNQCKINLAVILREKQEYEQALQTIDECLKDSEFSQDTFRHAFALSERGLCLVKLNRINEAIQDGVQATFMVQSDRQLQSSLYLALAHIYYNAQMPAKTLEVVSKILELGTSGLPYDEKKQLYGLQLESDLQVRQLAGAISAGVDYLQV